MDEKINSTRDKSVQSFDQDAQKEAKNLILSQNRPSSSSLNQAIHKEKVLQAVKKWLPSTIFWPRNSNTSLPSTNYEYHSEHI